MQILLESDARTWTIGHRQLITSLALRGDAIEGCEHLNRTTRAQYPARTTDFQLQPPTTTAATSTIADSNWRATHPVYDGVRRPMRRTGNRRRVFGTLHEVVENQLTRRLAGISA